MKEYTDFNVLVRGKEIVFRHTASTVEEFLSLEGDIIYDIYGSQAIRKQEIISVQLNPVPYVRMYVNVHNCFPNGPNELWAWIDSLSEEERESMLSKFS